MLTKAQKKCLQEIVNSSPYKMSSFRLNGRTLSGLLAKGMIRLRATSKECYVYATDLGRASLNPTIISGDQASVDIMEQTSRLRSL